MARSMLVLDWPLDVLLLGLLVWSAGALKIPLISRYEIKVLNSVGEALRVGCYERDGRPMGKGFHTLKDGARFWFNVQRRLLFPNDVYNCRAQWDHKIINFTAFDNNKLKSDNSFDARTDGLYLGDTFLQPWVEAARRRRREDGGLEEEQSLSAHMKRDLFSEMSGLIQTRIGAIASSPNAAVSFVRSSSGPGGDNVQVLTEQRKARQAPQVSAIGYGHASVNSGPNNNGIPKNGVPNVTPAPDVIKNQSTRSTGAVPGTGVTAGPGNGVAKAAPNTLNDAHNNDGKYVIVNKNEKNSVTVNKHDEKNGGQPMVSADMPKNVVESMPDTHHHHYHGHYHGHHHHYLSKAERKMLRKAMKNERKAMKGELKAGNRLAKADDYRHMVHGHDHDHGHYYYHK